MWSPGNFGVVHDWIEVLERVFLGEWIGDIEEAFDVLVVNSLKESIFGESELVFREDFFFFF